MSLKTMFTIVQTSVGGGFNDSNPLVVVMCLFGHPQTLSFVFLGSLRLDVTVYIFCT